MLTIAHCLCSPRWTKIVLSNMLSSAQLGVHHQRGLSELTVQFSSVPWPRGGGGMRNDSALILFQSSLQEALVSSSGMGWVVHSSTLSIQHFLCWHGIPYPTRCPEGWLWSGCLGAWHAQTMQVSVSWELPEEVHWFCAPSSRCGETSSGFKSLDPSDPFCQSASRVHVSQP